MTPGTDIVIADEPERFAEAVVGLLRDTEARRRIESAARRLVVEHYDWAAVAEDFEEALVRLRGTERHHPAEPSPVLAGA